jgi:thymidylate synthase (FAD)
MKVEFVSKTQPHVEGVETADELIAYCARVSNPSNQHNSGTAPNLLRYLIEHKHWSPFEMVNMCVSIETSRAIAAQILRHRSFSFQEFSQRYAAVDTDAHEPTEMRYSHEKNRQSSVHVMEKTLLIAAVDDTVKSAFDVYELLLKEGVASETARMVLPLCTRTKLYMNGTIRSWIHYLEQRCDEHTQKEHRQIADDIRSNILRVEFPSVWEAVFTVPYPL